jgi:hypothetical protein
MQVCVAVVIAAVLAVLSPGFSNFRTKVQAPDGTQASFKGFRSLYAGKIDTVKLVVVHGMGEHTYGYSDPLTEGLAKRLDLTAKDPQTPQNLVAIGEGITVPANFPYAQVRRRSYQGGGKTLEVFEVDWFPLANAVKGKFETQDAAHDGERALVNRLVKDQLVDDSLSDPLMYLGASGPFIRNAVKQVLCQVVHGTLRGKLDEETCAGGALESNAAVAFVTFSLGSRITFDSVSDLYDREQPAMEGSNPPNPALPGAYAAGSAGQLLGATARMFMLANQLPLLGLARTSPLEAAEEAANPPTFAGAVRPLVVSKSSLDRFLKRYQMVQAHRTHPQPLEVVTISDPNDLLSYAIPEDFAGAYDSKLPDGTQAPPIAFVNVTTLIAQRFLIGAIANPVQAHTGHVGNSKVMKMLVEGRPAKAGGR